MKMTIADVVKVLKEKDQTQEVQFMVMKPDGAIIAMHLDADACDVMSILKCFKQPKKK